MVSTLIRRATAKDIARVLELHCSVFNVNTNYLLLLGRGFLQRFLAWYCATGDAFMLVAEGPSGIAGYIAVHHGPYYRAIRANWPSALLGFVAHPTLAFHPMIIRRLRALLSATARPRGVPTQRACLAYLAVDPAMRVKGLAPALVQAALNECRSRGWYDVVTSMHTENLRARSLYAMLGFENSSLPDAEGLASVQIDLHPKAPAGNGKPETCSQDASPHPVTVSAQNTQNS